MMHKLEKSPGIFSDRPGTTPKSLDLVVSPTCLREKERELFDYVCGLVEESERDTPYKSKSGRPHLSVHSRTVRGPFADRPPLNILHINPTDTASGIFCTASGGPSAVLWRTVRSVFLRLTTSLQNLWWTSLMNGGLSAHYLRTVRCTKFQTAQIFFIFLNSNFNLGSLLI